MKGHTLTRRSHFLGRRLLGVLCCALFGIGCAASLQGRAVLPEGSATSPAVSQLNTALASAAMQTPAASAEYRVGAEDLLEGRVPSLER
jgi:hypothetical protein